MLLQLSTNFVLVYPKLGTFETYKNFLHEVVTVNFWKLKGELVLDVISSGVAGASSGM